MQSSNRVILNSGYLYANMLVTMVVQLASVRILVNALGVADYGIYSIVAGVVALFAFINVAMAASTQRFLSYAIGEGHPDHIREIFYQSVLLHLIIGVVVLLLLEVGGLYYVRHVMQAPPQRIHAATVLLHCITASTFVNIITVPYEADINANENMGAIALINILDSLMKLAVAIVVMHVTWDKLQTYGALTMACLIITLLIKRLYCLAHYDESHFRWHRVTDWSQARQIAAFCVWNLIGSGTCVARYQGTALVLNQFFTLAVNTAYGIAQQVNGLLLFFSNSIVRAIRPQVVKSEGAGDHQRMLRLSMTTCKVTSLMVALLAVPLGLSIEPVLELWLGHAPGADCVMFCRAFLAVVFINQLTIGLQVAIESTGRIRLLQMVVGTMHLLPLVAGWLLFRLGFPPGAIMMCVIVEELVAIVARAFICRREAALDVPFFLTRVIVPCLLAVTLTTLLTGWAVSLLGLSPWPSCLLHVAVSVTLLSATSYCLILDATERRHIADFLSLVLTKLHLRP